MLTPKRHHHFGCAKIGVSSTKLANLNVGDEITDVVGPLGKPTDIRKYGTVVCAGGGVGVAPLLPIVEAMKQAGNKVVVVLAARTKDLIIMEKQMKALADEVIIMTDDGSYGEKGVSYQWRRKSDTKRKSTCVTIGPAIMMKFVSLLTKKYNLPTMASLNTIMVDGTGMCGACRITVGVKPNLYALMVLNSMLTRLTFDEMLMRLGAYKEQKKADLYKIGK